MIEMNDNINYKKIGLKCGIEIHQQLDTKHKLFCFSKASLEEKNFIGEIERKQHPVASELGEVDLAAQYEYLRDRKFIYQVYPDEVCLVETDEEPPRGINEEALDIALQIALMLNCYIPDEIHVMRKIVIDGSNTTSFQRTAIVGLDGYINYKGKKIGIKSVSLEEDSSAIVSEENGKVYYKLNRLGIPLVEISTKTLEGLTPIEIQEIAFNLGMICRSTNKVKKGIGSIRQDLNISIKGGARVEIKGIQELSLISKIIENEVFRQLSLLEIKKWLSKRLRKISNSIEVSEVLRETKNPVLKNILDKNWSIKAILLPKSAGLLKREIMPGKTLGKEISEIAQAYGIKGIIHSDEDLVKNLLLEDFKKVREYVGADINDLIILVGEPKDKKISKNILEKLRQLLNGVSEEVRSAEEDGKTRFTRPLPGAARMYPETDVIPKLITKEKLELIKEKLPEPWTKKLKRFLKYKLSEQLAMQILESEYLELFEKIVKEKKVEASIVANTFTSIIKDLQKREAVKIENLKEKHYLEIFDFLAKKKIVKEAIPEIIKYLSENPESSVSNAIKSLNLKPMRKDELIKIVKDVVAIPKISFEKALGLVMGKVRGRVDAQEVVKLIKKFLKK